MFLVILQPMVVHWPSAPGRAATYIKSRACSYPRPSFLQTITNCSSSNNNNNNNNNNALACGEHATVLATGGAGAVCDRASGGGDHHHHRRRRRRPRTCPPGGRLGAFRCQRELLCLAAPLRTRRRRVRRQPPNQTHGPAAPPRSQERLQKIRPMRSHGEPQEHYQGTWGAVGHRPVQGTSSLTPDPTAPSLTTRQFQHEARNAMFDKNRIFIDSRSIRVSRLEASREI